MEQEPEREEAMAAFTPDADGAFRVFFSILHLVKTPSKILPLLRSHLAEKKNKVVNKIAYFETVESINALKKK